MFKRLTFACMVLAAGAAQALDVEQAEKAAEIRQAVLGIAGWNTGPAAGMVKQRIPYDPERFQVYAERIAFTMTMIPDAFRIDTREFPLETEALDVIWEEHEEFLQRAADAEEKSATLAAVAKSGDLEKVTEAFLEMGQACKACHDKFREDD
ncbi:MAG: cytochrome c [Gammaproteobacteria bacterium]|jgi:cytochrome c556